MASTRLEARQPRLAQTARPVTNALRLNRCLRSAPLELGPTMVRVRALSAMQAKSVHFWRARPQLMTNPAATMALTTMLALRLMS